MPIGPTDRTGNSVDLIWIRRFNVVKSSWDEYEGWRPPNFMRSHLDECEGWKPYSKGEIWPLRQSRKLKIWFRRLKYNLRDNSEVWNPIPKVENPISKVEIRPPRQFWRLNSDLRNNSEGWKSNSKGWNLTSKTIPKVEIQFQRLKSDPETISKVEIWPQRWFWRWIPISKVKIT